MIDFLLLNRYQMIAIALAIICAGAIAFGVWMPPDLRDAVPMPFVVESGESLTSITQTLSDRGLIRSRFLFTLYVRANGDESRLQAGTYLFSRAQSTADIAQALARGLAELDVTVVIPEGSNLWEVDKRLADAGLISEGEIAKTYPHKEGLLFPDTYRFAKEATPEDIVKRMEVTFMEKTAVRSDVQIIIASLLEKEAREEEDMKMIAGIIEKRLERGMPLQIDASVAYGWCLKEFQRLSSRDCDVTRAPIASEIKVDGLYNTYRRAGLPRGAISNPGLVALRAAANPTESSFLYYLSTRDGGEIVYATTLAEHLNNRSKYLGL